jgi:aminoglycoside phosphotransferase (APT) family kinase protein
VLLTGPFTGSEQEVPRYLRQLAIAAGVDLSGWSWGVVARGEYDSQKVLVLLTPPGQTRPTGLVKLTRSAKYVDRLDNEERALRALTELASFADRVPVPWFAGRHGGRAVLGQSALAGSPFSASTRWSADCVLLEDCLTALGDLAASTVSYAAASDVADALAALIDRYERVYAPPDGESGALREQVAVLAALPGPLPVVLQHGDPHPGNLLVSAAGRTLFLDWESADPRGVPLWDILYFFRSYAAAASKRDGLRDQVRGAARHMVHGSPLGDRLVAAIHREATATGLPREAITPLIHACWVHHALEEATRMPPTRLNHAPSIRLLRTMLAHPHTGTLAHLTEGGH